MSIEGGSVFRDELVGSSIREIEQPDLIGAVISLVAALGLTIPILSIQR